MRLSLKGLDLFNRILICIALLFSLIWGMTFRNRIFISRNSEQYRFETFIVTGTYYDHHEDGAVDYWLTGKIGNTEERLFPRNSSQPRPASAEELLQAYPKGTKVSVMFNPRASDAVISNGESLRVIPASANFLEVESRSRFWAGVWTFAPVPLALLLFAMVRFLNRRSQFALA